MGKFISVDPERQFASPYLGMGNNPVNGVDPDGGKVFDYWIYSDGSIKYKPTGDIDNKSYVHKHQLK